MGDWDTATSESREVRRGKASVIHRRYEQRVKVGCCRCSVAEVGRRLERLGWRGEGRGEGLQFPSLFSCLKSWCVPRECLLVFVAGITE